MDVEKKESERRVKHFEQVCRDAGIKLTHQRMQVFREVARTADHPDAERIHQGVRKRIPTVSLDTVYRTLWLLDDLGLINTLGAPRERTRFDANLVQHHHFVCSKCGLTRDFYSDEFNELRLPQSVMGLGQVETTHVEVRGVCLKCADTDNAESKTSKKKEAKS